MKNMRVGCISFALMASTLVATARGRGVSHSLPEHWDGQQQPSYGAPAAIAEKIRQYYPEGEIGEQLMASHLNGGILEEIPDYEVVATLGHGIEIREYGADVIAMTPVADANDSETNDEAFRRLAGYIGVMGEPKNSRQERIEMTVPVAVSSDQMWFYLPSRYSSDVTPPTPTDPSITIQFIPPRTMAALTFSGDASYNQAARVAQAENLLASLPSLTGGEADWFTALYNPPWTPADRRRNEILIRAEHQTPDEVANGSHRPQPDFAAYLSSGVGLNRYDAHMRGEVEEETPDYTVVESSPRGYEIRDYGLDTIARSPLVSNDNAENEHVALHEAYNALAKYLGLSDLNGSVPENDRLEEIPMTAPVGLAEGSEMFFFLPGAFNTAESGPAPVPSNSAVTVTNLDNRRVAVLPYSGDAHANPELRKEKAEEFFEMLRADGVKLYSNDWYTAMYNPPWTPNSLKLNEVHVAVAA